MFVSAVFDLVHYTSWAYEVLARRLVSVLVVPWLHSSTVFFFVFFGFFSTTGIDYDC